MILSAWRDYKLLRLLAHYTIADCRLPIANFTDWQTPFVEGKCAQIGNRQSEIGIDLTRPQSLVNLSPLSFLNESEWRFLKPLKLSQIK
jgi:hypothetical protein